MDGQDESAVLLASASLLLASASPRRRELLERAGVALAVEPVDVDETPLPGEAAMDYLRRIVSAKADAARRLLDAGRRAGQLWSAALVADTAVIADGAILNKPEDDADAARMLALLSGRRHEVSTRFAILHNGIHSGGLHNGVVVEQTVTTAVWFRPLDDAMIARYIATGEGRDKAGAYGIQGIGAMLVSRIEGSYTNVVGLPLCEVVMALEQLAP